MTAGGRADGAGVVVVIPTYDEALNITEVLTRVRTAAPGADVLVVDSMSPDGTAALARSVGAEIGRVEVLTTPHRASLGAAYRAAFSAALASGYDVVLQMDADLSHEPEAIPKLLATLDEHGAAAVIGSRYVPGGSIPDWSWHRRALSRWGNWYAGVMLACGVSDMTSGFRAYRRETLLDVDYQDTRAVGYGFQIELAYRVTRAGGVIVETPITFTDRERGTSKMSLTVALEELWLVTWWSLRDRPWWRPAHRLPKRSGRTARGHREQGQGTHDPKNASSA